MALNRGPVLCSWTLALALTLGCGSQTTDAPDPEDVSTGDAAPTQETTETTEPEPPTPVVDAGAADIAAPVQDASPDAEPPTVDATPDAPLPVADTAPDAPAPTEDVPAPTPDLGEPADDIQTTPVDLLAQLPTCAGGVVEAAIATPLPKSAGVDAFTPWDGAGWDAVTGLVLALYGGDVGVVLAGAESIGYAVCRGEGAEESLVLFAPALPDTGHARAVWRVGPARALVLEAPHPVYDTDTAVEAAYLFETLQARGLIASGTHRCVSEVPSGCDGKTKACTGVSIPYPVTDMAHVAVSVFQALHGAFELGLQHVAESAPSSGPEEYLLLSVHGMAGDGVSVSNGTTADTHAGMLPAQLALALMAALPGAHVTSCNDFAGAVVEERLCGTTNVQGRWTNGSEAPCTTKATEASERFAHLEQTLEIRQNPEPVAEALSSVFPLWD